METQNVTVNYYPKFDIFKVSKEDANHYNIIGYKKVGLWYVVVIVDSSFTVGDSPQPFIKLSKIYNKKRKAKKKIRQLVAKMITQDANSKWYDNPKYGDHIYNGLKRIPEGFNPIDILETGFDLKEVLKAIENGNKDGID